MPAARLVLLMDAQTVEKKDGRLLFLILKLFLEGRGIELVYHCHQPTCSIFNMADNKVNVCRQETSVHLVVTM